MGLSKTVAAVIAAAGLIFGSAHAAPEAIEAAPAEMPEVIILELQPMIPGQEGQSAAAIEQEQMMMAMLLLQLLGAMQVEGEPVEVFVVPSSVGERI